MVLYSAVSIPAHVQEELSHMVFDTSGKNNITCKFKNVQVVCQIIHWYKIIIIIDQIKGVNT